MTQTSQQNALIDIRDICIDGSLPQAERIKSFISQVKNPYRFKVGDVSVSVSYMKNGTTLNDCFTDMLAIME